MNIKPYLASIIALFGASGALLGQSADKPATDSLQSSTLPEITIVGENSTSDLQQLPEIVGTTIYAGKKNALIVVDNVQGNTVTNTMRQVMAKVPGIHIWESDGSGIQIGIAARGLSPNRSWEFNVRQNGYDIAADPFGYPEAYYNPQLQSVQRIEVIRGQGALQYGPQFGGMVNYILKNGSQMDKPFQVETEQTVGSFGLFNSYNAVGGKTGKIHYYAFFDHRNAEGWRENSRYQSNAGFGTVTYHPTEKLSITAEFMRWDMVSQQPGGLTDAQFAQDARQSFRSRNWFNLDWTTAAVIANYRFSATSRLNVKLFGVHADRNSVGFMPSNGMLVQDTINAATLHYNARTLDIDHYRNYGMEARYITDYQLFGQRQTLSTGVRLYRGGTFRYKGGTGTNGTQLDLTLVSERWSAEIDYRSQNGAAFAENIFRLGSKVLLIPGIRYEYLRGEAGGYSGLSNNTPILLVDQARARGFVLAGIGTEWHATRRTEVYANISQAYRPIQFADLTTPPTTDKIDPNITDAKGHNFDLGYRGKVAEYLYFDISVYHLQYNNRVGTIKQQNADSSFYNLRTNVGNSTAKGVEAIAELDVTKAIAPEATWGTVSVFASYSYNDARYGDFKVITLSGKTLVEKNYANNKVENAPEHLLRSGLSYGLKGLLVTAQYSYVSKCFSDANNTLEPTGNGQNGLIPAYSVWDLTASYRHKKGFTLKAGVNNLTDARYFTRRAGGYPGPGLLPSDGRSVFISAGYRF